MFKRSFFHILTCRY